MQNPKSFFFQDITQTNCIAKLDYFCMLFDFCRQNGFPDEMANGLTAGFFVSTTNLG
jgi:hypothetical protein